MQKIIINTDGGARGNPGPAGAGVVAYRGGEKIFEIGKYLGNPITNNWAEYEALILALQEIIKRGEIANEIEIRMDSMLVVEQMKGNWKVKDAGLKLQFLKARELVEKCTKVYFWYIPREENKEADALVNATLDALDQ